MEYSFRGRTFSLTKRDVERVLEMPADRTKRYVVDIRGHIYPVKQAFCVATGLPNNKFNTFHARRTLSMLGYKVLDLQEVKRRAR